MGRLARGESLDPNTIQIAHVTSRCVRRAFLCGDDHDTGKCFEHRRVWIRERLEFLAALFAIDCLTFAVLGNHLHLILRSRPDIVRGWSDQEVAERWLEICPPWKNGVAVKAEDSDLAMITNNAKLVAELRVRLSDISWWMRLTCQKIAKQANREDSCTGHFWEGRFGSKLLLDEAAIFACAMYVDLNPIRAAMAFSLEDSQFTGAKARIDDLKGLKMGSIQATTQPRNSKADSANAEASNNHSRASSNPEPSPERTSKTKHDRGSTHSGWLSPLEIDEATDPIGADPSPCGRRASLKGFLPMSTLRYIELCDWTGRQLQSDKRGAIPLKFAVQIERLGVKSNRWLDLASQFGRLFKRAAGNSVSVSAEANRRGQNWMQAPGACCFD